MRCRGEPLLLGSSALRLVAQHSAGRQREGIPAQLQQCIKVCQRWGEDCCPNSAGCQQAGLNMILQDSH